MPVTAVAAQCASHKQRDHKCGWCEAVNLAVELDEVTAELAAANERAEAENKRAENAEALLADAQRALGKDWCAAPALVPEAVGRKTASLEKALHAEHERAEKAEKERSGFAADLYGYTKFVGPCAHGRDPWDRCDACGEGSAVDALFEAWAHQAKRAEAAEKERDELKRKLYGTDSFNPGAAGYAEMWEHKANELEAKLAATVEALEKADVDEPLPAYTLRALIRAALALARGGEVEPTPIPMVLHCPKCTAQHVDAPDERTPGWTNPPHRSHLCHACGHVWRPADVPTIGIAETKTRGKNDSPLRTEKGGGA